jgi:diguanylate cyclase (GGDEF)-like protein
MQTKGTPFGKVFGTSFGLDLRVKGPSDEVEPLPQGPRFQRMGPIAWAFLHWFGALIGWYLISPSAAVVAPLLANVSALAAILFGSWANRPARVRLWHGLALAIVFWLFGAALRGEQVGGAPLLSDLLTLSGYVLVLSACLGLLRTRGVVRHIGASLDGLVLGTSVALLTWRFMIEPLLHGMAVSPRQLAFDFIYQVIDILLLLVLAQLSFTDVSRTPSYWLFTTSIGGLLMGDLLWNTVAAGRVVSTEAVTLPYLVAYGALGASALHPSMQRLTASQLLRDVLPMSRVFLLAIALAGPTVLAALWPGSSLFDRLLIGGVGLGLSLLVLMRTARVTNAFARQADLFEHSATHDELTGLANRRFLMAHLRARLETAQAGEVTAVLFLDLDAFKLINDAWGHEVGDELLVQVAHRLQSAVDVDSVVARIGGDEFVVLGHVSDTEGDVAEALVQRIGVHILEALRPSFTISRGDVFVSASVGAAWHVAGGESAGCQLASRDLAVEMLRDADIAMYEAKSQGRGRLASFDLALRQGVRSRLDLENALRKALDTEELSLVYQPLIDLATRRLVGWEALARWERSGIGPVSPADFILVAEHTGLIVPLGEWVIREALSQLATWFDMLAAQGAEGVAGNLRMGVNVASRQLRDPNLVSVVQGELTRNGLPARALCVEVTESSLLGDDLESSATINELRALGASLAVDDFGTGYSALGYLKRFPFTTVKIDRSFVAGLATSSDDAAIVKAVLAMAQALGMDTVAEGIETEKQAGILEGLGCSTGQGYLFGRPAPAAGVGVELSARVWEWASASPSRR